MNIVLKELVDIEVVLKRTFENLSSEKQNAVIDACIREFGEHGYEKATTDRIIKRIGISKGGLYEYVSSKKGSSRKFEIKSSKNIR